MTKIWTVDAFANTPFTGNPAGVMIVEDFPQTIQKIAAEMNLSETAFVKQLGEDHFHIRWLTPATEVKLCGHATLATSHILFEQGKIAGNTVTFESLSGPLRVTKESDGYVMDFPLQPVTHALPIEPFSEALGVKVIEAVQAYDDAIVLVETEEDVRNLTPNIARLNEIDCRGIIVTAPAQTYDFVSRFFAPRVGVDEDPVTGSAHCKLADYWSKKLGKNTLNAFQASARGGAIHIRIEGDRVFLKGQAITMMEGQFRV